MEAERSSKTSLTVYQLTRCNIPQDLELHYHRRENLRSHKMLSNLWVNVKGFCVGHTIGSYSSQNFVLHAVVNESVLQIVVFHRGSGIFLIFVLGVTYYQ